MQGIIPDVQAEVSFHLYSQKEDDSADTLPDAHPP